MDFLIITERDKYNVLVLNRSILFCLESILNISFIEMAVRGDVYSMQIKTRRTGTGSSY